MRAANDTVHLALPLGATVQTRTWRAQRRADHLEVLDIRNAGRRGKTCARYLLSIPWGAQATLDAAAARVVEAVAADVEPDVMEAQLFCLTGELELQRAEQRSIEVDPVPAIAIDEPTVSVRATHRSAGVVFHQTVKTPRGPLPLDSAVHAAKPVDAAKMYAWIATHRDELLTMTPTTFRQAMAAAGIRCS